MQNLKESSGSKLYSKKHLFSKYKVFSGSSAFRSTGLLVKRKINIDRANVYMAVETHKKMIGSAKIKVRYSCFWKHGVLRNI